jgi:multidrug efflux pump subunit AcrA (membrane-fusion protein)
MFFNCAPSDQGGKPQNGQRQGGNDQKGGPRPDSFSGGRNTTIPVQTIQVQAGALTADRDTAGSVTAVSQSQVAATSSGIVSAVRRKAGDWVKEGEIIVELEDSQARLSLANAESSLSNARINLAVGQDTASQSAPKLSLQLQASQSALDAAQRNYDSLKAQFDLGGISESQLDNAKSQLAQAQANLEGAKFAYDQNQKSETQNIAQLKIAVDLADNQLRMARLNLQNTAIKAPFAGQLAAVNVTRGMFVGQNTAAFLIVSAERQIVFSVSPGEAAALSRGMSLSFTYGGKTYPVRISQAPSAPVNGMVPLTATFPASFAPPYGVVGTISYSVTLAKGILMPMAALQTLEDRNFVFIVDNNKVAVRNIVMLAETGIMAAVSGIDPGVTVILSPPPGLIEGASVQPTAQAGQPSPSARPQADNPEKPKGGNRKNNGSKPDARTGQDGSPKPVDPSGETGGTKDAGKNRKAGQ